MKDLFKMLIALLTLKWLFGEDGCFSCAGSGCGCGTFGTLVLLVIIYLIITYL